MILNQYKVIGMEQVHIAISQLIKLELKEDMNILKNSYFHY